MMTYERARDFAGLVVDRWLKLNGLMVTDHSLGIDPETIDQEAYESLIDEIAIEFSGS